MSKSKQNMFRSLFTIVFSLVLFISCSDSYPEGQLTVFRYNESKGIASLDPAFARNQTLIWPVNQIFNGLVQMDDSLNVIPCIANSWTVSDDGLIYTFNLRRDVLFHNSPVFPDSIGRQVTAFDFEYSFSRILDPKIASPGKWIFDKLDFTPVHQNGFKAENDSIFRIWLKEPFIPFLGMLTMPYCSVLPHEAVSFFGVDFGRNPVGTGPFRFKLWREDEKLILLKNYHYFEKDGNGISLPYLDAVSISFIKDKQSEFLEFMKGNLDFLNSIHPSYKDVLLTRSGQLNPEFQNRFVLLTEPYLNTEYLGFLCDSSIRESRNSPVLSLNVRKAINYGFDRVKMMKYMRNDLGTPALSGFVPEGLPSFSKGEVKGYEYNPDTSRYFLAIEGFPGGKGLPPIKLTTTSDYLDLCEYIQFELSTVGIKVDIEVATGASFRNNVANSNLVFFRGSWIADYPDAENYLSLFYSPNLSPEGPNTTHFANDVYDSLYRQALQTVKPEDRYRLYQKMDRLLIESSVIVPLYYDRVIRFIPLKLKGLGSNPLNLLILKRVKYRN
jgi:oligopeptide transport system substrate-binding protein